jgi:hypothetical protein
MTEVTEGDRVPCVYCTGTVTIDDVYECEPLDEDDTTPVGCEGTCDSCGRRVDYDYDPVAEPPVPGSRTGPGVEA